MCSIQKLVFWHLFITATKALQSILIKGTDGLLEVAERLRVCEVQRCAGVVCNDPGKHRIPIVAKETMSGKREPG